MAYANVLWAGLCASELLLKVNCILKVNFREGKIWAGLPIVGLASPNFSLPFTFSLQFTFNCYSLVHDPALNLRLTYVTFMHM